MQPSNCYSKRLSVSALTLVRKSVKQSENSKEPCEDAKENTSIYTLKWVIYGLYLRRPLRKKKAIAPNPPKKKQYTIRNCTWGHRSYFLEKWPNETRKENDLAILKQNLKTSARKLKTWPNIESPKWTMSPSIKINIVAKWLKYNKVKELD